MVSQNRRNHPPSFSKSENGHDSFLCCDCIIQYSQPTSHGTAACAFGPFMDDLGLIAMEWSVHCPAIPATLVFETNVMCWKPEAVDYVSIPLRTKVHATF